MTQPSQSILLQLTNALVTEVKLGAQLPQGVRWVTIQAIAGHDHQAETVRKLREEGQQSLRAALPNAEIKF